MYVIGQKNKIGHLVVPFFFKKGNYVVRIITEKCVGIYLDCLCITRI